jgi:hypothetical protein
MAHARLRSTPRTWLARAVRLAGASLALLILFGGCAAGPSGEDILRKSQAAYAALQSYEGTTTVIGRAIVSGATLEQKASARISFLRPERIRVDGRDVRGQPFSIVSDGKDVWLAVAFQQDGRYRKAESLESAIAAVTGIAAQAPTIIPAALIPLAWGFPWTLTEEAKLLGREQVAGVSCYKIAVKAAPASPLAGTRTFWVDNTSFLLRQLREQQDEQDLARMRVEMRQMIEERVSEVPEAEKQQLERVRELFAAASITSRDTVHSFQIERINGVVDPKIFEDPTK